MNSIKDLPFVPLSDRKLLPESSGIYFLATEEGEVLYIGKAKSLFRRWANHHRIHEVKARLDVRIHYIESTGESLDSLETAWIEQLKPAMNGIVQSVSGVAKSRSLRFSDAQWAALQAQSTAKGYSGPNAMLQAIADGDLPIGLEPPKLNTYADRIVRLEGEFSGVWVAIEDLRRAIAAAPPLTPTDLP